MKAIIEVLFATAVFLTVPVGYAQIDLNGNGTIDIPFTLVSGQQLQWFGQDLVTDEFFQLGLFGNRNYQIGIGHWIRKDTVNRVYVSKNQYGDFRLHSDENNSTLQLGQSRSSAIVEIGRDIDSSGLLDAAIINGARQKWVWKLSFDPLSDASSRRRILYGRKQDLPFLFRARGQADSLGLLSIRGKRSRISYRSINSRRKRNIRLREVIPPRKQPLLMRASNGRDAIGFLDEQGLLIVNSRGRAKRSAPTVSEGDSILIGDFSQDGEEKAAIFTKGTISFDTGEVKQLGDTEVQPFSGQARVYSESDVSPTTSRSETPTSFPSDTAIPTGSPTLTLIASTSPTVPVTSTATQMSTLIPT